MYFNLRIISANQREKRNNEQGKYQNAGKFPGRENDLLFVEKEARRSWTNTCTNDLKLLIIKDLV
jgi:hypothetical protein